MKIAFTGKGGVGKTTLASLFIQSLARQGKEVLAVDCDPDANLARGLGFKDADKIEPIAHMKEMINERMGVEEGNKTFFKLNPKIDDIPDTFSREKDNVKLVVMGTVEEGGSGCMCPESQFIKTLISHLVLNRGEHLVMDMEAGLEHFGRGTAESCDFVLVVVEPSYNSAGTAKKIAAVAKDIGIKRIYAIGNKIRSKKDSEFLEKELGDLKVAAHINFDEAFLSGDKDTISKNVSSEIIKALDNLRIMLNKESA